MGLVAVLGLLALFIASNSAVDFDYDCEPTSPHTYNSGSRQVGDRLLSSLEAELGGIWLVVRDMPISWPDKNETSNAIITAVTVTNQMLNEYDGGCIQLVEGGPGYSNVTLDLYTQRSGGLLAMVYVYGK